MNLIDVAGITDSIEIEKRITHGTGCSESLAEFLADLILKQRELEAKLKQHLAEESQPLGYQLTSGPRCIL